MLYFIALLLFLIFLVSGELSSCRTAKYKDRNKNLSIILNKYLFSQFFFYKIYTALYNYVIFDIQKDYLSKFYLNFEKLFLD